MTNSLCLAVDAATRDLNFTCQCKENYVTVDGSCVPREYLTDLHVLDYLISMFASVSVNCVKDTVFCYAKTVDQGVTSAHIITHFLYLYMHKCVLWGR